MAYTNSYYDESKVKQYMDENTYIGQYTFHVPGNGTTPCFVDDPHVRLTRWGANRWTNNLYIEEQLNNRYRKHTRRRHDYTLENLRENIEGNCEPVSYPTCEPGIFETQQSRAVMPAWTLRDANAHHERDFPLRDHQNEYPLDAEARLVRPEWTRNTFKDTYVATRSDTFLSR